MYATTPVLLSMQLKEPERKIVKTKNEAIQQRNRVICRFYGYVEFWGTRVQTFMCRRFEDVQESNQYKKKKKENVDTLIK